MTTLVRRRAVLYSILVAVFVVSLILSFTSVGFPYSDNKSDPRLQRFRVIQTKRTFYDHSGGESFTEVGFMLSVFDRNSARTLESSFDVNELSDWNDDAKCATETYCGFPMYRFDKGRYLKDFLEVPTITPTRFNVIQSVRNPNDPSQIIVDLTLQLTTLTMIYITPGEGWKFINSSINTSEKSWRGKSFQLSKITYGKWSNDLLKEFITLEVRKFMFLRMFSHSNAFQDSPGADPLNAVTVTVVTIESVFNKNDEYVKVMEKFPAWTFAMQQRADSSSYVIKE